VPTLADIFSATDSFKRKLTDTAMNPIASFQQMVGNANDRAGQYNQQLSEATQEPGFTGEKTQALAQDMANAYNPVGMTVWHGSPYKFTQFDPSKIGTGEGQQVFGHGLYVAENPKVGQQYQKQLSGIGDPYTFTWNGKQYEDSGPRDPERHAVALSFHQGPQFARKIAKMGIELSKSGDEHALDMGGLDYYRKMYDTASQIKRKDISAVQGALYKIDLPDEHIEKMMDWDKPISKQSDHVQQAIEKTKGLLPPNAIDDLGGDLSLLYGKQVTPNQFLNTWESLTGSKGSGEAALAQNGVPGLRYFDGSSRSKKTGSRNYVIFPGHEHILDIQEMNNIPVKKAN